MCFKYIPAEFYEEGFMERIFTCDGMAPFGHSGIIATAVKYKEVGANKTVLT